MRESRFRAGQAAILGLYLVLALAYGFVNPAFESPDELLHFDYVEALLRTQRLPVATAGLSEYHQPPLYYLTAALLTAWLPPGPPAASLVERNPFWPWRLGEVGVDNKSQFVHGPEQDFPWQGTWLRLHLARWLTTLFGLLAVWATGRFALTIWPQGFDVALLAMAGVAFIPQFLYLSGSVSNDVPAVACAALALLLLGRTVMQRAPRLGWPALLGLVLGCSVSIKMSMFLVVAVVMGTLVLYAGLAWYKGRQIRPGGGSGDGAPAARGQVLLMPVVTALVAAVVAAPTLWRNWRVYGDPSALAAMNLTWGVRNPALTLREMYPDEFFNIWTSFWARFGYGQIPIPYWIYYLCLALTVLFGMAALYAVWRRARAGAWGQESLLLLAAALLAVGAAVATTRYAQTSLTGSYGRFAFPALPAIALILAGGVATIGRRLRWPSSATAVGGTAVLCGFSVWCLLTVLQPAYTLPVKGVDQKSAGSAIALGDVAEVKVALLTPVLEPGGDALVQVDWRPLRTSQVPLIFVLSLRGPEGQLVGERLSYPGQGRTSTTFWQPGSAFEDVYRVPVDATVAHDVAPARVTLGAWFYDRTSDQILPVYDAAGGRPVSPVVAEAKLPPAVEGEAGQGTGNGLATIGDSLRLDAATYPREAQVGSDMPVELKWTVLKAMPADTKLFIHLLPLDSPEQVAQVDELVLGGRYPGNLWAAGEHLTDRHAVPVPAGTAPGEYRLQVGMYPADAWSQRLPVRLAAGTEQDSIELGTVVILGGKARAKG